MSQPPVKKKRRLANLLGDPPRQASKATYIYNPPTKIANTTVQRIFNSGRAQQENGPLDSPWSIYRKRKMAGPGRRRMVRAKRRRRKKR
jgi:hypothetical protein